MNDYNYLPAKILVRRMWMWACIAAILPFAGMTRIVWAQSGFERPPIDYLNAPVEDSVAQLAAMVAAGEVKLSHDERHGYLPAVLRALDVPVNSQTLVFSKTSLQLHRISPRQPRALYFNDDVYVGWCQRGDVLEIAATDAKQGATFYTLSQDEAERPRFVRDRGQCLTCHASSRTQNVPGYLVRSVYPDAAGQPILGSGTYTTDMTSPLQERWGGWYVTGSHGAMRHMGNKTFTEQSSLDNDLSTGINLETLDAIVSTDAYLTPHSDLVALMVLGHQTQMHNAIAAANYETRMALHQSFQMNDLLERPPGTISESAARRIQSVAENVVEHLLMCDEHPLQSPVRGTSGFAAEFATGGIRDPHGRSLRDLDLNQRLFRYPCSYLIYNSAFDGLPDEVRTSILVRLADILQGNDQPPQGVELTPTSRQEILEILLHTKPEFARLALKTAQEN